MMAGLKSGNDSQRLKGRASKEDFGALVREQLLLS